MGSPPRSNSGERDSVGSGYGRASFIGGITDMGRWIGSKVSSFVSSSLLVACVLFLPMCGGDKKEALGSCSSAGCACASRADCLNGLSCMEGVCAPETDSAVQSTDDGGFGG